MDLIGSGPITIAGDDRTDDERAALAAYAAQIANEAGKQPIDDAIEHTQAERGQTWQTRTKRKRRKTAR